jgi:rod shape-determining protein MreD
MIQYYTRFFSVAIILLLLQMWVFDHVNLFGYSNPYLYLLLLITYRLDLNQFTFIFIGFIIGFILDLLTHTAGAHAIACVSIAFLRPLIARFALGVNFDQPNAIYSGTLWTNRILYLFLMIFIHQLIFSFVAYFSISHLWKITQLTLVNSLFTFVLVAATINLLERKK